MRLKVFVFIQITLFSMLLVGCYPNDDVIFDKYSGTFKNPEDYDPEHPDPSSPAHNSYVDLGLTSGNLWAEYNIGAKSVSDIGDEFEYSPYIVLQNWKDPWLQPSKAQCQELINECFWEETTLNGVKGVKVTGPNENTIFFPIANGTSEYYWTSTATAGYASCLVVRKSPYIDSGNESFEERHYVRACRKGTDELKLAQNNLTLSSTKQTAEVQVISTVETIKASSEASWIKITVSGKTIILSCDENATGNQRSAKVYVVANKLKRILTVLQDAPNNTLELSASSLSFDYTGGTKTVKVTTNGEYRAEASNSSWISVSIDNNSLKITAEPNSTLSPKTAKVMVTTGTVTKQISIQQSAGNKIPNASITSVTTPTDQIVIKGAVDAYDASIKEYGLLYCYSSSSSKPDELSLDSYMSITRMTTKNKKATINITINGNGNWYQNKNYYFFRAYVVATDGEVYYSNISDGVKPYSR